VDGSVAKFAIMAELNPPQQSAVDTLSGPLLVLAGAGTGKTRVVTFRIANLIRNGTHADRILAVTFTNKASHEMQERVSHQLKIPKRVRRGQPTPPRPSIGTFHSHCVQILKRHAKVLGYPEKFTIYDRSDAESVARTILRDIKVHEAMLKPSDFLNIVSSWKNLGVRPDQSSSAATTDKEHLASSGYKRYQRALRLQAAFDFDDLLVCTEELLQEHESVRRLEAGRYDHVLVDEYQDTNGSQYRIIRALAIDHRNLCVVGDDDQSIYGWRGAEVRHILNFKSDWPEAKMVRLEDNYRSTDAILQMANRLIAFNSHRHEKTLRAARPNGLQPRILQFPSEGEEAKGIIEEIAGRIRNDPSVEPKDFAILFRTNEQPRPFEMELRRCKLPYVITGSQSFFDRKEVRDLLAYFRWLDSPDDELSLLRIINVPPRGMGASTIDKLLKKAVADSSSVWAIMQDKSVVSSLPTPAQNGIHKLKELQATFAQRSKAIGDQARGSESPEPVQPTGESTSQVGSDLEETAQSEGASLMQLVSDIIQTIKYRNEVERLYPDVDECAMRLSSIEEVINAVAQYEQEAEQPNMHDFLSNVALAGREFGSPKEKEMKRNAISLMTYHSAKGLEFPIVYMVGMEEGILPHRKSIISNSDAVDEERRLCYVGVTRAQDELSLTLPMSRFKWGKARPTYPSRFLYEVTGQADNPNRLKAIRAASEEAKKAEARKT
jgi:DNA helicase II / ATP-dependent DNA helicase PcrA